MSDARVGEYEVMFLTTQGAAAQLGSLIEHFNEIFSRAGAEVIAMRKWDDRRLAFEIDKQKRGVYFLAYVSCSGDAVSRIERDVVISEQVMRVLITRADHLTREEMLSHDGRQALADEARLRAQQSPEDESRSGKVRLGAPEAADAGEEPADAEEAEHAEA